MEKKNAMKLIADGRKNLQGNEYNLRKMRGVEVSCADVESAILYAEAIIQYGTYKGIYMEPFCEVRTLLEKYGLLEVC